MHDGIVGIALKRAARKVRSHPRIERVVHEQVRQDRRDRRTLRSSPGSLLKGAIRVLQRRSQPPLDIQQHPAAVGHRFDRTNHEVPRHLVEELLDIKIDRPVELPAPLPACRERVMGRLTRPVAIGVLMKPWLHQRLQEHGGHRLRDPVRDRRHPEQTDTRAVRLGDLDRLDRRWKPGPRAHPIPDLVEVPLKVSLELLEILPIHAGGALVGLDPPPRLPRQLLGNRKRLAFRLWHISSRFLPEPTAPVDRLDIPDEPAPSLHPHPSKQALHRYYGPVRQRAPRPVLNASGFRPWHAPSRDLWGLTTPVDAFDARLLTFHARAADQDHAASTPDTAWPATRAAAKLIPRTNPLLGFDVISTGFDASNDDARPEQEPRPDDSGTSS
jgi:hypothetical protein